MGTSARLLLQHHLLSAQDARPTRWLFVLHGILGTGNNFRGLARALVEARPQWGAVLVDLRMHGRSQGFPPPHDLQAVAQDLVELEAHLKLPLQGVMGHSYGGKVALAYAAIRGPGLGRVWTLDSAPGARPGRQGSDSIARVLDSLRACPPRLQSRAEFQSRMTADGHPPGVAAWLAMNLERDEKGLRLRLDLDAIDAMLEDYFARDLWPVLEGGDGPQRRSVVIAGQSEVWSPAAINRAEQGAAARPNCLRVHRIPEAGHWLHVDAPSPLLDCLLSDLDATP